MPYVFDPNDAHIKQALTNISMEYKNDELIWPAVTPIVPVTKLSDFYYVWDEGTNFQITSDQLSATGMPNPILMKFSTDLYACKPYGLLGEVPVITLDNADDVLKPLGKTTENVTNQLQLQQEIRSAAIVFNQATYPVGFKTTLAGVTQWSDFANSDPIGNILTALDACLQRPNTITFGADTWKNFRQHPKVIAAIFPSGGNAANRGMVSVDEVLNFFSSEGITKINIGRARYNTANIGQATSLTRIWGKHCALTYTTDSPAIDTASFAYAFASNQATVTRELEALAGARGVEKVKVAWEIDTKATAPKAGYYFENAVA
jgi:hypothetical protein